MEDIRREYYGRIRKFLSIPLHFKGFIENPGANNIFPRMVERYEILIKFKEKLINFFRVQASQSIRKCLRSIQQTVRPTARIQRPSEAAHRCRIGRFGHVSDQGTRRRWRLEHGVPGG